MGTYAVETLASHLSYRVDSYLIDLDAAAGCGVQLRRTVEHHGTGMRVDYPRGALGLVSANRIGQAQNEIGPVHEAFGKARTSIDRYWRKQRLAGVHI